VVSGLGEDGDRPGVLEIPPDLGRGGRLIDGDEHRTGEPDREVNECPLVAGLAHQGKLVAGLHTRSNKSFREGAHLREELAPGDVGPATVGRWHGEQRQIGRCIDPVGQQYGRVCVRICSDKGGGVVLLHGNSFGTGQSIGSHSTGAPKQGGCRGVQHWPGSIN
jgi:hypothetical protein